MKLGRRDFMLLAGGAAGGAAVGGVTLKGISRINEALAPPMASYPGAEQTVTSICRSCSGGCGLRVRMVGGRVVKTDGNPLYPVNRGGVCPTGQVLTQWLYHPDRVLAPRRRSSAGQKWESTTWPEATNALDHALQKLRAANRQDKLLVVSGRAPGMAQALLARFLGAYGKAELIRLPDGMETSARALELMAGGVAPDDPGRLAYDLENARCVLSFGCDLLQGWGTPAYTLRVFGEWKDNTRPRMTSLIHFGPRLSVSAGRADEWISTRVGTWGAVALGLAYVLVSEDLYNHEFVDNSTFGFDDWKDDAGRSHTGFRTLVREEYRLSRVSEITGIPTETLVRVAREFADGPGGIAIGPQQTATQPGRLSDALAVQALNALVGSIGTRGGVRLLPDRGWSLPKASQQEARASRSVDKLVQVLQSSPEVLILDEAASLLDLLSTKELDKLRQIPLIVSTASMEDATTSWATLQLPDCTPLESWADGQSPASYPFELLSVAAPVVPPMGESRPWVETLLALSSATAPDIAAAIPWKETKEALQTAARNLEAQKRGYIFGSDVDEQWQRLLERSGWWEPDWSSKDQFWDTLAAQGGWWDPVNWSTDTQRSFTTPSKRFEFYPQKLDEWLRQQPNLTVRASSPDWDRLILPHHAELLPPAGKDEFPLLLEPYEVLSFFGGGGRELPYLQQLSSQLEDHQWHSWVELSGEDAQPRGILSGDWVWVESSVGKIRRRALVLEGSMPGIVSAPKGGAPASGRWAFQEDSLADILVPVRDPLLGTRCAAATRVKIYKV
jgi:anaerobic selenocysteine-containing dehydrogenase